LAPVDPLNSARCQFIFGLGKGSNEAYDHTFVLLPIAIHAGATPPSSSVSRSTLSCFSSGKKRQAQTVGGGIGGVDRLLQFHPQRLVLIEGAGLRDEQAGKVDTNVAVALLVGVGRGVARHGTLKVHVIKLPLTHA
jgi:hypothetical protein